jgi:hypothetical protein
MFLYLSLIFKKLIFGPAHVADNIVESSDTNEASLFMGTLLAVCPVKGTCCPAYPVNGEV